MARYAHRTLVFAVIALSAVALAAVAVPRAGAKSYTDVTKKQWAYTQISSVTNRIVAGHRLLDDYGSTFKPELAITRYQLARTLVLASGHYGEKITPVVVNDVPPGNRYYTIVQMVVHLGYMSLDKKHNFNPGLAARTYQAENAVIGWLKGRYTTSDWSLLSTLRPSTWEPNKGWKTGAPSYLPSIVASRQLELRYNHPASDDGQEVTPGQPIDRAEIAFVLWRAYKVQAEWVLGGLANYKSITFPLLSDRQRQIASFALKYVGYPYIWGGEYPTKNSPYGYQKAGGFDCSGFVFYVMKMHFGYGLTVNERGAHDMAAHAKPRITRSQLKSGDLIFFGPKGPSSTVDSIYHAALYLGNGWFIQSTGSTDGVSLASLDTSSYYKTYFAWGRRLLTTAQLTP